MNLKKVAGIIEGELTPREMIKLLSELHSMVRSIDKGLNGVELMAVIGGLYRAEKEGEDAVDYRWLCETLAKVTLPFSIPPEVSMTLGYKAARQKQDKVAEIEEEKHWASKI